MSVTAPRRSRRYLERAGDKTRNEMGKGIIALVFFLSVLGCQPPSPSPLPGRYIAHVNDTRFEGQYIQLNGDGTLEVVGSGPLGGEQVTVKGTWTAAEDYIDTKYITANGMPWAKWYKSVPKLGMDAKLSNDESDPAAGTGRLRRDGDRLYEKAWDGIREWVRE